MGRTNRIPLFPLEVVLFPGSPLPLHIFEPRYKLMTKRCLENQEPFGVVLARSEGIAEVGCTAEIVEVVKKYEDGRMDILTMGREVIRVVEVFDEKAYLEAKVEYLEDDSAPDTPDTQHRLQTLFEQCHRFVHHSEPSKAEFAEGYTLAYRISSELPLDLEYKQEVLEVRSEPERQRRLLEKLAKWLPQLVHVERARAKAAGNGHGLREG